MSKESFEDSAKKAIARAKFDLTQKALHSPKSKAKSEALEKAKGGKASESTLKSIKKLMGENKHAGKFIKEYKGLSFK